MGAAGARWAPGAALVLAALLGASGAGLADNVIWAVNAGGEAHVDVNGIHFRKDPLEGRVGRGEAPGGGSRRPGHVPPPSDLFSSSPLSSRRALPAPPSPRRPRPAALPRQRDQPRLWHPPPTLRAARDGGLRAMRRAA